MGGQESSKSQPCYSNADRAVAMDSRPAPHLLSTILPKLSLTPIPGSCQKALPPHRQAAAWHCRRFPRRNQRTTLTATRSPSSSSSSRDQGGQREEDGAREQEEDGEGEGCRRRSKGTGGEDLETGRERCAVEGEC